MFRLGYWNHNISEYLECLVDRPVEQVFVDLTHFELYENLVNFENEMKYCDAWMKIVLS